MAEQDKFYLHLSSLISQARLQNGFATLRELYRVKKPDIDYQTWLHAESGRRIPAANLVIKIGECLNIERESLIIAYCKDKFDDPESQFILESFRYNKFVNPDTLMSVREHDRFETYIFTAEQVKAMQDDVRLRLYLSYTYDKNYKTTFRRLAAFFNASIDEVEQVINGLKELKLVEVNENKIHRLYPNTAMPRSTDVHELRKKFLIQSLELNIKPDSYISNCHAMITEESYKTFLSYLDFVEANLVKLNMNHSKDDNRAQFQIAIAANRIKPIDEND